MTNILFLGKIFGRKRCVRLKKGKTKSILGITLNLKKTNRYLLSIVCQRGTVGENKVFDIESDTISYEFEYKRKRRTLIANISDFDDSVEVTIE